MCKDRQFDLYPWHNDIKNEQKTSHLCLGSLVLKLAVFSIKDCGAIAFQNALICAETWCYIFCTAAIVASLGTLSVVS